MRTSVWLIRHGQTELNRQRRYQGQQDSPLTAYALRQCAALERRLRRIPFTAVVVGGSGRTQTTADLVLGARDLPRIVDQRWNETNHGHWEGLTYAEVVARFPDEARSRFADALHGRTEGGESLADVHRRVSEGWNALLSEHHGGRILIVTHATPIQLVLCAVTGMPPTNYWNWRIDLGSITALDVYPSGPIIRMVNTVPQLPADADAD